jgi:hypothetical protein
MAGLKPGAGWETEKMGYPSKENTGTTADETRKYSDANFTNSHELKSHSR